MTATLDRAPLRGKTKINGLKYIRKWNVVDFMGKYHLSRFENKELPLPGTQIRIERDHEKAKEEDVSRFVAELKSRHESRARRDEIKLKMAELSTNVYFRSIIGSQISNSEDVIVKKEEILSRKPSVESSSSEVSKFLQQIHDGRSQYVAFAIRNGFDAINGQDSSTGDTALHIAAQKGFIDCLEELLQFHADPDIQNFIGNSPIHYAWQFWRNHKYRKKEEREEQEEKTCAVLHTLLSYGGYVDIADQFGQSALHIACRLGPLRAVKLLLFFRADSRMRTKEGLDALEIAQRFRQEGIVHLIRTWRGIGKTVVHADFIVLWHKFLVDYSRDTDESKSAAEMLFDMSMSDKVKSIGRDHADGFAVDDALLRSSCKASLASKSSPKPWDEDWRDFVAEKMEELKNDETIAKYSGCSNSRNANGSPNRYSGHVARIGAAVKQRQRRLPALRNQTPKTRNTPKHTETPSSSWKNSNAVSRRSPYSSSQFHPDFGIYSEKDEEAESSEGNTITVEDSTKLGSDGASNDGTSMKWDDFFADNKSESTDEFIRNLQSSHLSRGRLACARAVALDGKFSSSTKRPSTSSVMFIAHRRPEAPLKDTEEEFDPIRAITSQGRDFDLYEICRQNELRDNPVLKHAVINTGVNAMGEYEKQVVANNISDRDRLFNRLVKPVNSGSKPSKEGEEEEQLLKSDTYFAEETGSVSSGASSPVASPSQKLKRKKKENVTALRASKIDLVSNGRARFVDKDLLPPDKVVTKVEKLAKEFEAKVEKERLRKSGLSSEASLIAARKEMEKAIAKEQRIQMGEKVSDDDVKVWNHADPMAAHRARQFLDRPVIAYGKGRIQSSYNSKIPLEDPWSTTRGR